MMTSSATHNQEKQPITRAEMLVIANKAIKEHEDFMHGMHADDVEEKNGFLIFRGNYFLDEKGMPTAKSTAAFNMFKHLAHLLSEQYTLID